MKHIREIPPSVATAIAEGRLDPVSMEAFNCFPTSGEHQSSIFKRTSSRLHKPEISMESKEEAGFMVFASHKAIEKESIGKFFNPGFLSLSFLFDDCFSFFH